MDILVEKTSPLEKVKGIKTNVSMGDILSAIKENRERQRTVGRNK